MNRFHVHVSVRDLQQSIRFYATVFGREPSVVKQDYAKWMLEDPRLNFAISTRGHAPGINHLGIQVESDAELTEMRQRIAAADVAALDQKNATCCYAKSDKYWVLDPQGVAWETFHSLESAPVFGEDTRSAPGIPAGEPVTAQKSACCAPL
jgi:lactoylglutathione lyase